MKEDKKSIDDIIARARKCYNELLGVWEDYYSLYEDETYWTHMNILFYELEEMIDHMKEVAEEKRYKKYDIQFFPCASQHAEIDIPSEISDASEIRDYIKEHWSDLKFDGPELDYRGTDFDVYSEDGEEV